MFSRMAQQPPKNPGQIQAEAALRHSVSCYEKIIQEVSILSRVDELDDSITEDLDLYRRLLEVLSHDLLADNCSLMLWNRETQSLELCCACGFDQDTATVFQPGEWQGERFHLGQGIVGQAMQTGVTQRIQDVARDSAFVPLPNSRVLVRSLMCIPLRAGKDLFGAINLSNSKPGVFDIHSEKTLQLVGARVARLIRERHNARLAREARQEFSRQRLMLDQFFELNPCCICVCDLRGNFIRANSAFRALMQGTPGAAYNLFEDPVIKNAPFYESLLKLREGETVFCSAEISFSPGTPAPESGADTGAAEGALWFRTTCFPLLDKDGKIVHIAITHENITQRKRAEDVQRKALAETEKKMFERSADLATAHRQMALRNNQLSEANEELAAVNEELTAMNEELSAMNEELQAAIREREKTETLLREEEKRYRSLVEDSIVGIAVSQGDRFIFVNRALCDLAGYSEEELKETPLSDLVHPSDREKVMANYQLRLMGQALSNHQEFRGVHRSGRIIWLRVHSVPIVWENKSATLDYYLDITARKLVEDEHRDAWDFLSTVVNTMRDNVSVKDAKLRYVLVNDSFARFFDLSREQLLGAKAEDLFPEAIAADMTRTDHIALNTGEPYEFEVDLTALRGTPSFISVSKSFLTDAQGRKFVVSTSRDITARKVMERELNESEQRFSVLADNFVQPICIHQGGRYLYANNAMLNLLKYTLEEFKNGSFEDIIQPEQRHLYRKQAEARLRGEKVPTRFTCPLVDKEGTLHHCEVTAHLITIHGAPAAMATVTDLTRFQQSEEQALADARFFQALLDGIHEGIAVLDKDLRIVRTNAYFKTKFAHLLPLEGRKCHEIFRSAPKTCPGCPALTALKKKTPQNAVLQVSPDAAWMECGVYPRMNDNGEVESLILRMRDATECVEVRKTLQRKLKYSEALVQIVQHLPLEMGNVEDALRVLGETIEAESIVVFGYENRMRLCKAAYLWRAEDAPPVKNAIEAGDTVENVPSSWYHHRMKTDAPILSPDAKKIPPEAATEKSPLLKFARTSSAHVPVVLSGGQLRGILVVAGADENVLWDQEDLNLLRATASCLANYLPQETASGTPRATRKNIS